MTQLPNADATADPVHGAHLRHRERYDADTAQPVEARAYSWGYTDGFDAALDLPADHPLLGGIKEKLLAEGWNEPSCWEASCGDGDHTYTWPCDLVPAGADGTPVQTAGTVDGGEQ
jgi:hypothetical protein